MIWRALSEVLAQPGFRQHAEQMRRAIEKTIKSDLTMQELEGLGSTGSSEVAAGSMQRVTDPHRCGRT